MADVKIRKLENWVVTVFQKRAYQTGRILEEELRILLTESALSSQKEFAETIRAFRNKLAEKYDTFADSTPFILKDREGRG